MKLVPNSWGSSKLEEFNKCHTKADGKFCSRQDVAAAATAAFPTDKGQWSTEQWGVERKAERAWSRDIEYAISHGILTPEDAKKLGWTNMQDAKYEALPPELFHVTTGAEGVLRTGLKSREQLAMDSGGVGLGGGPSDTISLTDSLQTARVIRQSIIEARRVARGELTPAMMLAQMKRQPVRKSEGGGAFQSDYWKGVTPYDNLIKMYSPKWNPGDKLPLGLRLAMRGKMIARAPRGMGTPIKDLPPGQTAYRPWKGADQYYTAEVIRDMTPKEKIDFAWSMYGKMAMVREMAGGKISPLFFTTDYETLAKIPVRQIKIMRFTPKPKARGYKVSALGEWRVHVGSVLKNTGVVEQQP